MPSILSLPWFFLVSGVGRRRSRAESRYELTEGRDERGRGGRSRRGGLRYPMPPPDKKQLTCFGWKSMAARIEEGEALQGVSGGELGEAFLSDLRGSFRASGGIRHS